MADQVLEQVLLVLNAKVDGFEAAMKEAAKSTKDASDKMSDSAKKMTGGIETAQSAFAAFKSTVLLVAGAGGLASLVKSTLDSADELARLSSVTGVSTDGLQELKFAASQLNVEQSTLTQSIGLFNKNVGEAVTGNSSLANTFSALGIELKDGLNLKSTETLFKEASTAIAGLSNGAERAAVAQQLFGKSGRELLPILEQGQAGLEKFASNARSMGLVLDKELIARADETNDKLSVMHQVISAQLSKAILDLAPHIQSAATAMISLATNSIAAVTWATKLTDAWANLIKGDPSVKINNLKDTLAVLQGRLSTMEKDGPNAFQKIADAMGDNGSSAEGLRTKIAEVETQLVTLQAAQKAATEGTNKAAEAQKGMNLNLEERNRIQGEAQKLVGEKGGNKGEQLAKELETLRAAEEMKLQIKGDTGEAIMERESELQKFYEDQNAAELERLVMQNEAMTAIDAEKYAADIEANKLTVDSILNERSLGLDNYLKAKKEADEKEKKADELKQTAVIGGLKSFFGSTMQLSKGHSKELFMVSKALAIGTAVVDGYVATNKALANPPGPPFSIPQALAAAAQAAVNVAGIAATGFKTGADMIPGYGFKDSVPALLQPGERVVKTDTNKVLEQFLQDYRDNGSSGGGGQVSLEIKMNDNMMDFIETQLVARGRVQVSVAA
jgi:hypothetical protein